MHSLTITDGWVFLPSFRKEKHQGVVGSSCVLIGRSHRHTLSPIGHVLAPPRLCTLAEMLRLLSSHQSVQFILHEQTGNKVGLSLCKSSGELWVSFWEVLTAGMWNTGGSKNTAAGSTGARLYLIPAFVVLDLPPTLLHCNKRSYAVRLGCCVYRHF